MAASRPHTDHPRTEEGWALADVAPGAVRVPDTRLRALDPDWAAALAAMMSESGQNTPIDVVRAGAGFVLVAGLHRLEAAKRLKWRTIRVQILPPEAMTTGAETAGSEATAPEAGDALRQHEILDNLARKDLNALERCAGLAELKQVHERLYPQTRKGGDRKSQTFQDTNRNQTAIFAFCHHAADATGLSDRAVRLAIAIWQGLSADSRKRLKGTPTAEKQSELKALSDLAPDIQSKVLDLILAPVPKAASVADALVIVAGRPPLSVNERLFKSVSNSLSKLNSSGRAAVFRQHRAEILDLARREGWFDA
ncbi:ParB N-terminal domain-containing protein [Pannonibacter carbonis]|uniref:ParB N-terminal domain-containing protein n=1 Tax=Pannonibacter carbonis TaxID=2067569 RepID=UPI000D105934|nr:ParB N-terminal domain-containing protein [Pannonibacter carbonis]